MCEDAAHFGSQLHRRQNKILIFVAVLTLKSAVLYGKILDDLHIGKVEIDLRIAELVHYAIETVMAGIFLGSEVSKAVFIVGRTVIHHKGLDRVAEKNVCAMVTLHHITEETDGTVIFFVNASLEEGLGVLGCEDVYTEGILKRDRCVHLIDSYLVSLCVSRYLAHYVRTVICVSNRRNKLGGEHVAADELGKGVEHIDSRNVHVSEEGEEVTLEDHVVTDVVLKESVTRETGIILLTVVGDL